MESIAIGKNLAATNGYEIDATQEMLALGIANVVGAGLPRGILLLLYIWYYSL